MIWGGGGDDTILGSLGNDLLCGGPGADLIHGGRGNDEVDGGAGDGDRAIGDLGDDHVLGGAGAGDEVAGDLGIDIVNGGAGNEDLVHGDYGWDRMSGGAGKGDIASFATDVAGGKGAGVWVSLARHGALGDGHDKLFRFESIEGSAFRDTLIGNKQGNVIDGGPGDDQLLGGGGPDTLRRRPGRDGCKGAKGGRSPAARKKRPSSAYVSSTRPRGRRRPGDRRRRRPRRLRRRLRRGDSRPSRDRQGPWPAGRAASTAAASPTRSSAPPAARALADGRPRPRQRQLRVEGSLLAVGSVRLAGNPATTTIHGGPEDDLIEAGPGADKLYGGDGADGLVGGLPGPTYLYGEGNGDLLAAGGGCAGGALVGGPGRDDASFAETQAHPGLLIISFPKHAAWIDEIKGCDSVHLSRTNEDMEGSFDWDVLIGDGRANSMLGQPGEDVFFGNGGDDVIDARDGVRDFAIQCGQRQAPAQEEERQRHDQAHRQGRRPRPHRLLRPGAVQLRHHQTRHPRSRPQRLRPRQGGRTQPPRVLIRPVGYEDMRTGGSTAFPARLAAAWGVSTRQLDGVGYTARAPRPRRLRRTASSDPPWCLRGGT